MWRRPARAQIRLPPDSGVRHTAGAIAMTALPRFTLLGVGVHAVDYAQAADTILAAAREKRPLAATALAVHGVMTGHDDPDQRARLNRLDLVTPDGQPVRWALNFLHHTHLVDRVYGPFLTLKLCEQAARENLGVFFYGSDEATLRLLVPALVQRCPGLRVAGVRPSRFRRATDEEWAADVAALRSSGADLFFCGLGCPRQEVWVGEMRAHLERPLLAVGAAFSFWSGRQKMAPAWMQRHGLEWLFRFAHEPRRLWKRYLLLNPRYLAAVARQKRFSGNSPSDAPTTEPPILHWS